ncbi:hypothetical protein VTI74DRAFT_9994 [Chaetomium olivicolor]
MDSQPQQRPVIPLAYRLLLTTIEPLIALCGALQALHNPDDYTSAMTRGSVLFSPGSTFLYTELAGAWLYFAFVEAVVLRLFADDLRLWRLLCAGMLLSDVAWAHSVAQAVGGWAVWLDVGGWSAMDHAMFWTSAPIAVVRLLIVLGAGVGKTGEKEKKGE